MKSYYKLLEENEVLKKELAEIKSVIPYPYCESQSPVKYIKELQAKNIACDKHNEELTKTNVMLEYRLRHLLKSRFIRSFDEKIPFSISKYKRDINEADKIKKDVIHGRWLDWYLDNELFGAYCSECGGKLIYTKWERENNPKSYLLNYCSNCGAKMDGEEK